MEGRKTASDELYSSLKRKILSLDLVPGAELSINELCQSTGFSRSPVRDALLHLSREGLVDIYPQRGCWVNRIDMMMVEMERFLRLNLETGAARIFLRVAKSSDIARMRMYLEAQKEAIERRDDAAFFEADDAMHHVVFSTSGLERMWSLLVRECTNHERIRLLSFRSEGVLKGIIDEHERLIAAFENHDIASALEIENYHLAKLLSQSGEIIAAHPDYFVKKTGE